MKSACRTLILTAGVVAALLPSPADSSPGLDFATSIGCTMSADTKRLYDEGWKLIHNKQPADASRVLEQASSQSPDCFQLHASLAVAYQNSRETRKAIDEYKRTLELRPRLPAVTLNIAHCYSNLGDSDEALYWYDRYLQENPGASDAQEVEQEKKQLELKKLVTSGNKLVKDHKYVAARQVYEQAASSNPNSADLHFRLASTYALAGDFERAISEFQLALSLDPKLSDAVYNIAVSYQNMGRVADSINWYQRYRDENPSEAKAATAATMIELLKKKEPEFRANPYSADYIESVTKDGVHYRWAPDRLPIKIHLEAGTGMAGYRESFRRLFIESLDAWAKASQNRLRFKLVKEPAVADVTCQWTSNPADVAETGRAVEQGWTKAFGKKAKNGDIYIEKVKIRILTRARVKQHELSDDEMKVVCLHEIGHMLGLHGHSTNNRDVMFFSESPSMFPSLSRRDKATIFKLYESYPEKDVLPSWGSAVQ